MPFAIVDVELFSIILFYAVIYLRANDADRTERCHDHAARAGSQ